MKIWATIMIIITTLLELLETWSINLVVIIYANDMAGDWWLKFRTNSSFIHFRTGKRRCSTSRRKSLKFDRKWKRFNLVEELANKRKGVKARRLVRYDEPQWRNCWDRNPTWWQDFQRRGSPWNLRWSGAESDRWRLLHARPSHLLGKELRHGRHSEP